MEVPIIATSVGFCFFSLSRVSLKKALFKSGKSLYYNDERRHGWYKFLMFLFFIVILFCIISNC